MYVLMELTPYFFRNLCSTSTPRLDEPLRLWDERFRSFTRPSTISGLSAVHYQYFSDAISSRFASRVLNDKAADVELHHWPAGVKQPLAISQLDKSLSCRCSESRTHELAGLT